MTFGSSVVECGLCAGSRRAKSAGEYSYSASSLREWPARMEHCSPQAPNLQTRWKWTSTLGSAKGIPGSSSFAREPLRGIFQAPRRAIGMIVPRIKASLEAVAHHDEDLDRFDREIWSEHIQHGFWK